MFVHRNNAAFGESETTKNKKWWKNKSRRLDTHGTIISIWKRNLFFRGGELFEIPSTSQRGGEELQPSDAFRIWTFFLFLNAGKARHLDNSRQQSNGCCSWGNTSFDVCCCCRRHGYILLTFRLCWPQCGACCDGLNGSVFQFHIRVWFCAENSVRRSTNHTKIQLWWQPLAVLFSHVGLSRRLFRSSSAQWLSCIGSLFVNLPILWFFPGTASTRRVMSQTANGQWTFFLDQGKEINHNKFPSFRSVDHFPVEWLGVCFLQNRVVFSGEASPGHSSSGVTGLHTENEGGIEPLFGARGRDMRRRDGAAVKIEATSFFWIVSRSSGQHFRNKWAGRKEDFQFVLWALSTLWGRNNFMTFWWALWGLRPDGAATAAFLLGEIGATWNFEVRNIHV